ncbi:MAG: rhodanese-related sulfurtransferase [Simkaniaceae bacterium]
MSLQYLVISYYCFTKIENPEAFVKTYKKFCSGLDICGRVYISEEGVNGQVSVSEKDAEAYIGWIRSDGRFQEADIKIHSYPEHAFEKMAVKYRKQLVALDEPVDLQDRGEYLEPEKWREKLEEKKENRILLDVRNAYEWKVGHFEGALLPKLETFREFPKYVRELKDALDPENSEVMMYCTGGIRCELFSALLKKEGFKNVFQLKGGIINYGLKEGKKHWKGKLFVFDDRLVVPISDDNHEVISTCFQCKTPTDVYYNCANMDCNDLFLSCSECLKKYQGCCSEKCKNFGRVRPFDPSPHPKPFRKLPHDQKKKLEVS